MHRHNDIRVLIHSMDSLEKKEFIRQNTGQKFITKIFCALALDKNATAGIMSRNLKLSDYLYRQKCNIIYTATLGYLLQKKTWELDNKNVNHFIDDRLIELHIERGLHDETEKILKKELETSAQYEDLNRLIFLLEKQLKNNSFLPYENADVVRAEILKRIKSFSDQREVCTHLYIIYTRLLNLRYTVALRTTVLQQQEITLLQRNLIHYLPAKLNHTISLIYYYQASLLAEFMMGTTDSTIKLNLQLLNCWIQKPHQINAYPELFIRSVSVQAYTNFLLKEISVAKSYADSYRQLAEKHLNIPFYKQWFLIVEFHTLTKILHKTFRYDELTIYFAKNWDGIYHSIRVLRAAEKLDLLVTASITFFVLGDLQHAENYIQESKEINLKVNRVDTLYFTFIFHCLILFEKKEWNRLNSLINSEYHFLYSHKSLMPFEKDMLLFIKKMPFIIIKDNGIQKMELFLQKLDSYKDDKSKKLHFAYFDFYAWIQSKIEGIGYRQYRVSNADHLS